MPEEKFEILVFFCAGHSIKGVKVHAAQAESLPHVTIKDPISFD
jgi:hypothetical protein